MLYLHCIVIVFVLYLHYTHCISCQSYTAVSLPTFIRSLTQNHVIGVQKAFSQSIAYNNDPKPLKVDFIRKIRSWFTSKTIHKGLIGLAYGWLKPESQKVDEIRWTKWIQYYNIDASARTIPHKFGPQKSNNVKFKLEATDSHIMDKYGYLLHYTRFLERGGESYQRILVEQMGSCVANNMIFVEQSPQGLHIKMSMDMGTEANPDNVRNCIVQGIQTTFRQNNIEMDDLRNSRYTNHHGIETNLADLQVTVKLCI